MGHFTDDVHMGPIAQPPTLKHWRPVVCVASRQGLNLIKPTSPCMQQLQNNQKLTYYCLGHSPRGGQGWMTPSIRCLCL